MVLTVKTYTRDDKTLHPVLQMQSHLGCNMGMKIYSGSQSYITFSPRWFSVFSSKLSHFNANFMWYKTQA